MDLTLSPKVRQALGLGRVATGDQVLAALNKLGAPDQEMLAAARARRTAARAAAQQDETYRSLFPDEREMPPAAAAALDVDALYRSLFPDDGVS